MYRRKNSMLYQPKYFPLGMTIAPGLSKTSLHTRNALREPSALCGK